MAIDSALVEVTIVLGSTNIQIRSLLRMGRGAVVMLDANQSDDAWLYAGGVPIARARLKISGENMTVEVTEMLKSSDLTNTAVGLALRM